MTRTVPTAEPVARPAAPSRPTLVDYLLMLAGAALSVFAAPFSGLHAEPQPEVPSFVVTRVLPLLPTLLLLPVGVLMLWPLFYATQWVLGRKQVLTWGEWLWGVSWLGYLVLIGWVAWATLGEPPPLLNPEQYPPPVVWVVLVVPALALISLVLVAGDLIGRWRQPWTHTLGLALALWPALPLGGILFWGKPLWDKFRS
jgi:hypothetical protein